MTAYMYMYITESPVTASIIEVSLKRGVLFIKASVKRRIETFVIQPEMRVFTFFFFFNNSTYIFVSLLSFTFVWALAHLKG